MAQSGGAGSGVLRTLGVLGLLVLGIGGFFAYKVKNMSVSGSPPPVQQVADPVTGSSSSVRPSEWSVPANVQQVARHPAARGGVPVEVQFSGVETLSRGWLSEDVALERLSLALASCVDGVAVVLVAPDVAGQLRAVLDVPARQNRCVARRRGTVVDVAALLPAATGLVAWRDGIASIHDALGGMQVGVRVSDARGGVTVWADGDAFAGCVGVDGEDTCFDGGTGTHFPFGEGRVAARVGAVLGP